MLSPEAIEATENEIELLDRVIVATEDWAKIYTKNPDLHAKLIKLEASLTRKLRKYFRELAKDRINNYINWYRYQQEAIKAYSYDVTVDVDEVDTEDNEVLKVVHDPLQVALSLGAEFAEEAYSMDLGLNQYSNAIMNATNNYVGDLVKGITNTTKERLQNSISQSIRLGETTEEAKARIFNVINDPRRAAMIARTESVRAYSKGISVFGEESKATGKIWEISSAPCETCAANDVGEIPFDDDFPSGDSEPPAHPNCRCGYSLVHNYDSANPDDGE